MGSVTGRWAAVLLLTAVSGAARADLMTPGQGDRPTFVSFAVPMSGSGSVDSVTYQVQDLLNQLDPSLQPTFLDMISLVEPMEIEDYLTINGTGGDWDKDGFLETSSGDVNPLGYVVFHFRDHDQNVRVLLGFLLGGPAIAPNPSTGGGGGGGGGGFDGFGPPPTQPPTEQIPEPTSLVLLSAGGALLLRRRRRRAS